MRLIIISLFTLFASNALANLIVVEEANQFTYIKPACPICDGGTQITNTTVQFSMVSCMKYDSTDFKLDIVKGSEILGTMVSNTLEVKISDDGLMDCFGPTHRHEYSLSTEMLKRSERVIILNPSKLINSSSRQN